MKDAGVVRPTLMLTRERILCGSNKSSFSILLLSFSLHKRATFVLSRIPNLHRNPIASSET
jgi:hypothetical protein